MSGGLSGRPTGRLLEAPSSDFTFPAMQQARRLHRNDVVDGRYRILESLLGGAMSVIYRAVDERTGEQVALKMLPPGVHDDDERCRRFTREIETCKGLVHDNVVTIRSSGLTEDGCLYYAMDFVPWPSMDELLDGRPCDEDRATQLLRQLAEALAYLHSHDVVHRDVKPSNVLVGPDLQVVLVDLGLAFDERLTQLTETGQFVGTPVYAAPEVLQGERACPKADQFSWGVIAFELLTGTNPLASEDLGALMATVFDGDGVPDLRERRPDVSAGLAAVVNRCLAKDPTDRFSSMDELVAALDPAAPGTTALVAAIRPDQPPTRSRTLPAMVTVTLLVVLGMAWLHRPVPYSGPEPPTAPAIVPVVRPVVTFLSAVRTGEGDVLHVTLQAPAASRVVVRGHDGSEVDGTAVGGETYELMVPTGMISEALVVEAAGPDEGTSATFVAADRCLESLDDALTELRGLDLLRTVKDVMDEARRRDDKSILELNSLVQPHSEQQLARALGAVAPVDRWRSAFRRVGNLTPLLLGTSLLPTRERERLYAALLPAIELCCLAASSYDHAFDLRPLPDLGAFALQATAPSAITSSVTLAAPEQPRGYQAPMYSPTYQGRPAFTVDVDLPSLGDGGCWLELDVGYLRHMMLAVTVNDAPPIVVHDKPFLHESPHHTNRVTLFQSLPPWQLRPGRNRLSFCPHLRAGHIRLQTFWLYLLRLHVTARSKTSDRSNLRRPGVR